MAPRRYISETDQLIHLVLSANNSNNVLLHRIGFGYHVRGYLDVGYSYVLIFKHRIWILEWLFSICPSALSLDTSILYREYSHKDIM